MIDGLPFYLNILFILTVLLTFWFFQKANGGSRITFIILSIWIILQSGLALSEFYLDTSGMPPKFVLLPLPALLTIIITFSLPSGRAFIDGLNLKWLTNLHIVRVPVEICLYLLFVNEMVPELMTFAQGNYDILSGITAPFIAYFYFTKKKLGKTGLIIWNVLALGLLLWIVSHAIMSLPFEFQSLSFEQPNLAVLYFPFNLLPGFVVPIVLFAHLAAIRQLSKKQKVVE